MSLLLQNISQHEWEAEEKVNFHSNGIMLDCSRNGVPTVETIKRFIYRLAHFGMNRFYLYMEDILEIEGYPYWGYMRGRYSKRRCRNVTAMQRFWNNAGSLYPDACPFKDSIKPSGVFGL